ncbi:MAG: phage shock protein PspA [Rhodospirillaceae bacterium]
MGIFSRLSDIVNSNLTNLLDRAEDPSKMIRLMIQEMEDTLVEVRSDAARLIAEKKEGARRIGRLTTAEAEWTARAKLALERDREDLAKAALVEKAKVVETAKIIDEDLAELDERLTGLDADISRLQNKLQEAKAKQQTLIARSSTAQSRLNVRETLYDGRADAALARFSSIEKKVDEIEGQVEAYDMGGKKSLAQEIAELEAESDIEDELAKLKASLSGADKTKTGKPNATDDVKIA